MTFLLEIKEKLRKIYIDYSYAILPVLKFALAMIVFMTINNNIGFLSVFKNIFIILIMALVCALLPVKMIVVFGAIMILGHSYALGIEIAAVTLVVFLLLLIFAGRFIGKDVAGLFLTPLAFGIGIPCAVPICFGLKRKPYSAVSVCCGTFIYHFISVIKNKAPVLKGGDQTDMLTNVLVLLDGIIKDKMLVLNLVVMAAVLIIVYVIRRIGADHAWSIAICLGAGAYLVFMIAGGLVLDLEISMISMILGTIGAVLVGIVLQFFIMSVDYSRTEKLEFEDDEYYYYVKAVPKMTISKQQRKIKTISSGDSENPLGSNREEAAYDENDLERKLEESLKEL